MTLHGGKPAEARPAVSVATTPDTRPSSSESGTRARAVALDQLAARRLVPGTENSDGSKLATNAYPDLGAMAWSWAGPSDLHSLNAALNAAAGFGGAVA